MIFGKRKVPDAKQDHDKAAAKPDPRLLSSRLLRVAALREELIKQDKPDSKP